MYSHFCIHIHGILLRIGVVRIGVLNCAKKVILESKGFISIIYIRPVYFPLDYKYLSMRPYDPCYVCLWHIYTDRKLAWESLCLQMGV